MWNYLNLSVCRMAKLGSDIELISWYMNNSPMASFLDLLFNQRSLDSTPHSVQEVHDSGGSIVHCGDLLFLDCDLPVVALCSPLSP